MPTPHQSLPAAAKIQHLYGRESGVTWGISGERSPFVGTP